MRYSRIICDTFERLLKPGGPLAFIVTSVLESQQGKPAQIIPLDLQLRERGRTGCISVYAGLTSILNLCVDDAGRVVHLSASRSYLNHFSRYGLEKSYPIGEVDRLASALSNYFSDRCLFVNPRYYRREGHCQGWLSCHFGRTPNCMGWLQIDRELVLGHTNELQKAIEWTPIKKRFDDFALSLRQKMLDAHGIVIRKPREFGNELDCAFWDPTNKRVILAEAKHGSDAAGIYLSVIQVAAYLAAWRWFTESQPRDAADGIFALLNQKARLGLLPRISAIPDEVSPPMLSPAVIVQDPKFQSECWKRMALIRAMLEEAEPGCLDGLHVFGIQNGVLTDITVQALGQC